MFTFTIPIKRGVERGGTYFGESIHKNLDNFLSDFTVMFRILCSFKFNNRRKNMIRFHRIFYDSKIG